MRTTEDQAVAAGHSVDKVDPARWRELLDELWSRVAGRFARADLRVRARAFVAGPLADLPRKNCWTLAEHAGDPNPDGMQHLLARAGWDEDKVRADGGGYLVDDPGDPEAGPERPGRRLPGVCQPQRARDHRPGAVPAPLLDR